MGEIKNLTKQIMTREERELFEQCKLQLVHIHDVVGRKQFYTTKDLIKKIDVSLTIAVFSQQRELLKKWWKYFDEESVAVNCNDEEREEVINNFFNHI